MNQFQSLPYTPIAKIPSEKSSLLVVKAKDSSTQYIMKTFPVSYTGKVQYDNERLISKLSHPYIIKMKESYDRLHSVVLEHAPNGDFCTLLMSGTKLPEIIARTYFHQLIEGVDYLHKNGIAHLDLKLDNLLLAATRSMKIIDFDLSQKIDEEKRGCAKGKGTSNYRAPEVRARKCNNFKAADIYSMGVIVFSMYTSLPPYTENDKGECDTWYQLMMNDQAQYWAKLSKFVNISEDFKELFAGMVCEKPDQRMDISKIRASNWFNGPILSDQELEQEMQKLYKTKILSEHKVNIEGTSNKSFHGSSIQQTREWN